MGYNRVQVSSLMAESEYSFLTRNLRLFYVLE